MDLGLHDRVYVLTGGTRGLGRATAEVLVAEGARVVVSSRDTDAVDRAVGELGAERAHGVSADNADAATPQRLVDAARDRFGRLDGALVSVGGPPPGTVADTSDEAWRSGFESVFLGAVRLVRAVADALGDPAADAARGDASIALVLSGSVREPIDGLAVSNGLRPGLAGVAKTLAREVGPRGIRVNGLLPGRIDTDRVAELDAAAGDPAAARSQAESRIALRRYGEPAEFGRVAAFVLSPAGSYLSGVMLPVDGGHLRGI